MTARTRGTFAALLAAATCAPALPAAAQPVESFYKEKGKRSVFETHMR